MRRYEMTRIDIDNDNDIQTRYLWSLRHWLDFWQSRTTTSVTGTSFSILATFYFFISKLIQSVMLAFSCVWFCTVLTHVPFQLNRLFTEVVALLSGKTFLLSVWKHVIPQTIGANTRETALLTCKCFFSSVFEFVDFEIITLSTRIITLLTPEGLFPRMCPFVPLEFTSLCARVVTLCAPGRFLSRVLNSMWLLLEVISSCAGEIALYAIERFLSWMCSHVFL